MITEETFDISSCGDIRIDRFGEMFLIISDTDELITFEFSRVDATHADFLGYRSPRRPAFNDTVVFKGVDTK